MLSSLSQTSHSLNSMKENPRPQRFWDAVGSKHTGADLLRRDHVLLFTDVVALMADGEVQLSLSIAGCAEQAEGSSPVCWR